MTTYSYGGREISEQEFLMLQKDPDSLSYITGRPSRINEDRALSQSERIRFLESLILAILLNREGQSIYVPFEHLAEADRKQYKVYSEDDHGRMAFFMKAIRR